jgi:hypothetical protein
MSTITTWIVALVLCPRNKSANDGRQDSMRQCQMSFPAIQLTRLLHDSRGPFASRQIADTFLAQHLETLPFPHSLEFVGRSARGNSYISFHVLLLVQPVFVHPAIRQLSSRSPSKTSLYYAQKKNATVLHFPR